MCSTVCTSTIIILQVALLYRNTFSLCVCTDSLQTVLSLDDKEEVNGPGVPPSHGVKSSASSHDHEKKQSSKVEPSSPQVCIKFSSGWPFIQATLDIQMCILTLYRIN